MDIIAMSRESRIQDTVFVPSYLICSSEETMVTAGKYFESIFQIPQER